MILVSRSNEAARFWPSSCSRLTEIEIEAVANATLADPTDIVFLDRVFSRRNPFLRWFDSGPPGSCFRNRLSKGPWGQRKDCCENACYQAGVERAFWSSG